MAAAVTPYVEVAQALPFDTYHQVDGDTHALRNPQLPQQTPRIFTKVALTEAQKATRSIRAASEKQKHAALVAGLDKLLAQHGLDIEALAKEHSVAPEYLNKLRLQSRHFKDKRSVSLTNAKIHAKAIEVNGGESRPSMHFNLIPQLTLTLDLPLGERKKLVEIRQLMMDDPNYQNISPEDEVAMKEAVLAARELKKLGARTTNKSAAMDYRSVLEEVNDMVSALSARTGAAVVMFTSRSHLEDTFEPNWICSDNASLFLMDSLKIGMWDMTRLLEQWACAKAKTHSPDTLSSMRAECSAIINGSLKTVSQSRTAIMNYPNYDMNVVQKYSVKIVGWTFTRFVSPYDIHTIDDVRNLLGALRCGACHWMRLTKLEVSKHAKEMEARAASGETVGKKRKKRADAGVKKGPRKRILGDSNSTVAASAKKAKARAKASKGKAKAQLPPARSASVITDSDTSEPEGNDMD